MHKWELRAVNAAIHAYAPLNHRPDFDSLVNPLIITSNFLISAIESANPAGSGPDSSH